MNSTQCPGTTQPTDVRSCSGNGSKGFGKALGKCVCGDVRFVKQGRIYRHNKR